MKARGLWEGWIDYLTFVVPVLTGWYATGYLRWLIGTWTAIILCPFFLSDLSRLRYRAASISYSLYILSICLPLSIFFALRYPFYGRSTSNLLWTTRPSQLVAKVIGLKFEIRHVERLKATEKVIMVCNHQSNLDFFGFTYMPFIREGNTAIVCKKEIKYFLTVGWVAALCRMIFVDRMSKKNAFEKLLEKSKRHLDGPGKRAVLICPEGTRGPGGSLLPFKRGAFEIAMRLNVPIMPYVVSPYPIKPPHYFYRGTLITEVLEPIYPKEGETAQELSERTRAAMLEVYEQLSKETKRNQ